MAAYRKRKLEFKKAKKTEEMEKEMEIEKEKEIEIERKMEKEMKKLQEEQVEEVMEEVVKELGDDVAKEVVIEQEAKEVEDMDGGWEEEEVEQQLMAEDKCRSRVVSYLRGLTMMEAVEATALLASQFSLPSLPCPLNLDLMTLTMSAEDVRHLHTSSGLPTMTRYRRKGVMGALYTMVSCLRRPEVVVVEAAMEAVLSDAGTASLLLSLGLAMDPFLTSQRDLDREKSSKIMEEMMKRGRNAASRATFVEHAARVARELELGLAHRGHLQRLRVALK